MSQSHLTLTEVMRRAGRSLITSDENWDDTGSPTLREMFDSLKFAPEDGRIWFGDQRMMLLHAASYGALRQELIAMLGLEKTRELLMRVGHVAGSKDAEMVRNRWSHGASGDVASIFFIAGSRLHGLEGLVKVLPSQFTLNADRESYSGTFTWHGSIEAAEHVAAFGLSTIPVCWMLVGYANAYASAINGAEMLYKEIECTAMGAPYCRCVGRPAKDWPDDGAKVRFYSVAELVPRGSRPAEGNAPDTAPGSAGTQMVIGVSPAFRAARDKLEQVAGIDATVLLEGESGVGKEMFTATLHAISPRAAGPLVAVNCAAIPDTLIESELFGVERGAFTGATVSRPGRFERASGGTLFLDEISSMSLIAQGKLLRAVQEGEIERVGGVRPIKVDVRLVAATNVDLREEVRAGRFRQDLFFRLNVFPITLPPLRERRDDIPLLMQHFLERYSAKYRRKADVFTIQAVNALLRYDYPGNVRELQNIIERAVISVGPDGIVDIRHLFPHGRVPPDHSYLVDSTGDFRENQETAEPAGAGNPPGHPAGPDGLAALALESGLSMRQWDEQLCSQALARAKGNVAKAARMLGLSRAQLNYRLRRLPVA